MTTKYLIEFDLSPDDYGPRSIVWAGPVKDGPGWAPQKETAYTFPTPGEAEEFLEATYGPSLRECGTVVEWEDDGPLIQSYNDLPN